MMNCIGDYPKLWTWIMVVFTKTIEEQQFRNIRKYWIIEMQGTHPERVPGRRMEDCHRMYRACYPAQTRYWSQNRRSWCSCRHPATDSQPETESILSQHTDNTPRLYQSFSMAFNSCTVKPVLSSHPREAQKWLL